MIKTVLQPPQGAPAVVRFRGWVACRRDGEGPLGLILIGATTDFPGEVAHLAFSAPAPADLPDALEEASVERLAPRRFRITSGTRDWTIEGAAHLHREVGAAFYGAIPPRLVPWGKRLFWKVALGVASNRLMQRVLLRRGNLGAR